MIIFTNILFGAATSSINYTGAQGDFAPEMQKRALENQKRAPENCHRHDRLHALQCKNLFNFAELLTLTIHFHLFI